MAEDDYYLGPGEPVRDGLWCEDCMSHSGVESRFVHLGELIATLRQCAECHGYRITDKEES